MTLTKMPILTLIVAYTRNRTIGRDNKMPWSLPSDLAHFKRTTLGAPIVMGRRTWESLGRPLPGRPNIVISRNGSLDAVGAQVATSINGAIEMAGDVPEIFVIGGAQIYDQTLPLADRIVATEIEADIAGDAVFPELLAEDWTEADRSPTNMENDLAYTFVVYERVRRQISHPPR